MAIPLIRLDHEDAAVAADIRGACMAHGFFYVAHHAAGPTQRHCLIGPERLVGG